MSYYLFRSCRLDRTQTVDSYDTVLVGFRYLPQLLHIRPDEFRPAFAENPEDLRRFHSHLVVCIVQESLKYRHVFLIDIGCVRGDVFGCPDECQPDLRLLISGEAEHARPVRYDYRITAASDSAESVYRPLPQNRLRPVKEGSDSCPSRPAARAPLPVSSRNHG